MPALHEGPSPNSSHAVVAGFAPLPVTFQVQANVPGTIQQVLYDFKGDDIADFVTNSLDSIPYTYETNGEYKLTNHS